MESTIFCILFCFTMHIIYLFVTYEELTKNFWILLFWKVYWY